MDLGTLTDQISSRSHVGSATAHFLAQSPVTPGMRPRVGYDDLRKHSSDFFLSNGETEYLQGNHIGLRHASPGDVVLNPDSIKDAYMRIAARLFGLAEFVSGDGKQPVLIGVGPSGERMLNALSQYEGMTRLESSPLNINPYRDDTEGLPFDVGYHCTDPGLQIIHGRNIFLVDSVAMTGRTGSKALYVLSDMGRPESVYFAVLATRNGKEVPVVPNLAYVHLDQLSQELSAKLEGEPGNQQLVIRKRNR